MYAAATVGLHVD